MRWRAQVSRFEVQAARIGGGRRGKASGEKTCFGLGLRV